ncbi:3'-5' exonuclease [Cytophagaceae bacterium YF14B1]|uniref:DNA 3'-5' helicase n=1 Tax=Xanthocytophaga flava TaxID=3048013 RepID=A0AAE3QKE0_9BACT|nr:UvrD-helicase domain-containing protein [Xanthocytophaga flavus]MDJ1480987.1 3'-5' exonuclease [Xanthocytophaga flavus]
MNYLEGLNEPQREAVTHGEGPLMIIAGAGSGKTRVLTYRIAHLMNRGVDPFRIMALTFTNKAADEMRSRLEKVVGTDARNIWAGTFHSVFSRILRIEAQKIGFTSQFSIYDTDDAKSLIRTILKEMSLDDKVYRVNNVLYRISSAKNNLISAEAYMNSAEYRADDEASRVPELGKVYKTYQERLRRANAMDFDDLLFNTNVLFRDHVDVLNKYQQKFHYMFVDEFQDTNISQYLITKKIAAVHQNICVVGDDAQSIYAFRGANIQNILNFQRDFPDTRIVKLEQNYRSTQNIVNAANSVIAKNKSQLQKNVWTANEEGNKIELIKASSDNEEGSLIANSIFEEKMLHQRHNDEFAILYRTNAQSRAFEEALRKKNIKYRLIGGVSFYQRKEIKDLISYLRFTINQSDEEAFKRIINLPKRGIGDTTVAKIVVAAMENNLTLWEVVANPKPYLGERLSTPIENFSALIKSFHATSVIKDAYETAAHVAKASGLLKELHEDKTVEGLARYENVQELLNAIKEYVDNPESPDKSLSSFLQSVSLLTSADDEKDDKSDRVTLMTIHSAKGLEFKHVFIVGMEEDLFPSQMMLSSMADLEEERRLFYVAITRAEHKLTLSYAETRYRFGRLQTCEPSRFLKEIDASYMRMTQNTRTFETERNTSFVKNLTTRKAPPVTTPATTHAPSTNFIASDTSTLTVGMKVEHPKFGFGVVTSIDFSTPDKKAKIKFEKDGEKTLLLSFAKLMIHE